MLQASLVLGKDSGAGGQPHKCPGFLKVCVYHQLRNKRLSTKVVLKANHASQCNMQHFQAKNYTDFQRKVSPSHAYGFPKNFSVVAVGEVCQCFSGLRVLVSFHRCISTTNSLAEQEQPRPTYWTGVQKALPKQEI